MKFAFPFLLGVLCWTPIARAQDTYRTYRNARFGTTVRYPANLVEAQPESANGDGRKFLSRDGRIELTVYGFGNARNRSASGEMRRAISDWKRDGARLTYFKAGRSWFVLSGYVGADVFYEKTLLQRGTFHTLIWQYPKTLKKRLDASVSRSASSFFVGNAAQNQVGAAPRPQSTPASSPTSMPTPTPSPTATPRVFQTPPRTSPGGASGY